MPFTPCHIAAVLPLRRRLPFLALAVGAMVPDFGYYVSPVSYFSESAHTLTRSLTFCLPIGTLIVFFIYVTREGWKRLCPIPIR